jgi:hypothetical protein
VKNFPRALIGGLAFAVVLAAAAAPADAAVRRRCPNNRSPESATWLSIAHPGLGEW